MSYYDHDPPRDIYNRVYVGSRRFVRILLWAALILPTLWDLLVFIPMFVWFYGPRFLIWDLYDYEKRFALPILLFPYGLALVLVIWAGYLKIASWAWGTAFRPARPGERTLEDIP